MSLLAQDIVKQLLSLNAQEKQDWLEARIVALLGGTSTRIVTHLPPRRGRADGGLDGRMHVWRLSRKEERSGAEEGNGREAGMDVLERTAVEAAINVKVRKRKFTREQFGAFANDMDREALEVGLIITAAGLTPDVEAELRRHNERGEQLFVHLTLEQILDGTADLGRLAFDGPDLLTVLRENVKGLLIEAQPPKLPQKG